MIKKTGFTIIETLVAIGVLGVLIVTVVGIMLMSFRTKNSTESNESMSSKAVYILDDLRRNILDAEVSKIICPVGVGNSISFTTKSGGTTTLLCKNTQIASKSAENGRFDYLSGGVTAVSCENFVWCNLSLNSEVMSVGFSLNLETIEGGQLKRGTFYGTVAPRD